MPQEKRKVHKKVRIRHWLLLIIVRIIASPFIFLYFRFKPRYYRIKKRGPMLILINHVTEFDILLGNNLFNFPLYFVASDQLLNKGFSSWLLDYVFAPIPKSKSMSDIAVVPRIKRVIDEGGNVCIFPEGNMTMNGTTSMMPPAIGKLIKLLKVPVVFVESYGLYFSSPRWSRYRKYGPTGMRVKRIMEVADYQNLSGEAITDIVKTELDINAYEQQPIRKYRGFRKAEGLHRLVFTCPKCHQPFGMVSHRSSLSCQKCGYHGQYDVFGYLNDDSGRHDTVKLDQQVKCDYIQYINQHLETITLSDDCTVRYSVLGEKRRSKKQTEQLLIDHTGLKVTRKQQVIEYPFDEVISFAMQTRQKLIVYVKGNLTIIFKIPYPASAYQYLLTLQLLHNHHQYMKGMIDYEFIKHPDDTTTIGLQ